jgi:signal transduction histidine kinase
MKRPSALTVVTAALLVLLPTLAILQYRWVGQVSEAERDRMERNLRVSSAQFSDAFDDEIGDAVTGLRMSATTVSDGAWNRYADRHSTWTATAEHPELLANIFLIDAEGMQLRLQRWNASTGTFDPAEWPASVAAWRPHFEAAHMAFLNREPLPRQPLPDDDSLLVSGLIPTPRPPGQPPTPDNSLFGFTVVELDMDYVRSQMLPVLTERYFSNSQGDRYRVAIVDTTDLSTVVFRTDEEAPVDVQQAAEADSIHGAFRDPFAFLRAQGRGGFGGGGFGGGGFNGGGRGGGGGRGQVRDRADGDNIPRFNPDGGRWALFVQHELGSLDAAVGAIRRRNLGISFGVLLLLTGSVALLGVSSQRAQRLAKQQMEFVAGVSHELRTPVAVIRSAAENLSQGVVGSGDRVKRYGQMIESEARRLGEMVERVLQYAGIASGLGVGARVALAPADIIESAVVSAAPVMDGANVQESIAPDLPLVLGDQAALRSAVQNLIANAVKYGGADKWVGIRADASGRGRRAEVRITVEDHGPGIPADELPHIFEPFYRGADALSRQIHGNGLGLSLVQQIVAAHGGRVTVASKPGSGSAFTIHLPSAPPETRLVAESEQPVSTTASAVHS